MFPVFKIHETVKRISFNEFYLLLTFSHQCFLFSGLLLSCTFSWLASEVKLLNRVRLSATPWTVACQAPPSTGFSGKNTGVGCRFLLQGNLSNPGAEPGSPALQADALLSELPRKLLIPESASLWDSINLARALNPLILPCFHHYIFSSFLSS